LAVLGAARIESQAVGERLVERLDELGWSNRRLAMEAQRFAGCEVVGESQVSRILAGERFVPLTVKVLADTMGLSYSWLVDGVGDRLIPRTDGEKMKIAEENDPRLRTLRALCASLDDNGRDVMISLARSLTSAASGSKRGAK
jgi:hypothetical protein